MYQLSAYIFSRLFVPELCFCQVAENFGLIVLINKQSMCYVCCKWLYLSSRNKERKKLQSV